MHRCASPRLRNASGFRLPSRAERLVKRMRERVQSYQDERLFTATYEKFHSFTMIPPSSYRANLRIAGRVRGVPGCVVECGVWRGGMAAGIADLLGPDRRYFLFDSFEGLPPAQQIDGEAALAWQANKDSPAYFENCRAEMAFADQAMKRSRATEYQLIKGWFETTLPDFSPPDPIAVLRLDADWYASTMICLQSLFNHMSPGGIVLIDDYYTWDGCSKAVHDYLSTVKSAARIHEADGVCFLHSPA